MKRVETHYLKNSSPFFNKIKNFCHLSKNLYNYANYLVRQSYFNEDAEFLYYNDLYKIVKDSTDYKAMPTAQSAQQILRLLEQNWKSYFQSLKDYKKHPNKYQGRPKIPKYKPRGGEGYYILILTNQQCSILNSYIKFPKVFNGFTVKTLIDGPLHQVRFIYDGYKIKVEIVYEINEMARDNNKEGAIVGCDLGINNLATIAHTKGKNGLIINGRPLKSINQYYNKVLSRRRQILENMNNLKKSKSISKLTSKRNRKVKDYMHKASRKIIDYCVENDVNTIVIGENKGWKQKCNLSSITNQNFVQIPFDRLKNMIQYKAESVGISVRFTEESYTSGTSFLDHELPTKEYYNKSRRKFRGLFTTEKGICINADWNGAWQIARKVYPSLFNANIPPIARFLCK